MRDTLADAAANNRQPTMTVKVYPKGLLAGATVEKTYDVTDDLPADAIGERTTECIRKAWRAGNDPANGQFFVLISFSTRPLASSEKGEVHAA